MDDADRADDRIESTITEAIAAARRAPNLPPMGLCYNCQSELPAGRIFCEKDSGCEEDFEMRRKMKR